MAFANTCSVKINRSAFYDIQGNYYNGAVAGEWGIHKLFEASCPDAFHDAQARNPPPRCLPGTRVGVLKEIFDWAATSHERLLWISGPAGAGKSAIAQTLAEACANDSTLAGSFFFFHRAAGRNMAERLIASIVYQLAVRMPHKRAQIGEIVERDLSILHKPLRAQIQKLITPLFAPTSTRTTEPPSRLHSPFLIIIDGLDECQGDDNQRDIVECISELVNTPSVPLFCALTSRPERQIEESFSRLAGAFHRISLANPHCASQAYSDIRAYLRHGFNRIYQSHNLINIPEQFWPTDEAISELVRKSGGVFIYAASVLKHVGDPDYHPVERLGEVLDNRPGSTPLAELDHLYRCILGAQKNTQLLLRVLSVVCCCQLGSFWPVRPVDIEELLQLRGGTVAIVLRRMCSILDTDEMTFHHKSFIDFVHDKERAREYFIDARRGHALMAQLLLKYISTHAEWDRWFGYSQDYWHWHCAESGRWDENPQLLGEISKTLDFYDHLGGYGLSRYISGPECVSLRWFKVDEIQPPGHDYHPLDIQYRLFKHFLHETLISRAQVHIFVFYEDTDLSALMNASFIHMYPLDKYRPGAGQLPTSPDGYWECWVLCDNRKSFPNKLDEEHHHTVDPLVKRLLQEPGSLEKYKINIVGGHVEVVRRCLDVFVTGYPLDRAEPEHYSYARKYWTKHLSHVPPGNPGILDSLKRFDRSELRHQLTTGDIQAVRAWLELSGVTLSSPNSGNAVIPPNTVPREPVAR